MGLNLGAETTTKAFPLCLISTAAKTHFDELSQYLAAYSMHPSDQEITAPGRLTVGDPLTKRVLSDDVYDNWLLPRRQNRTPPATEGARPRGKRRFLHLHLHLRHHTIPSFRLLLSILLLLPLVLTGVIPFPKWPPPAFTNTPKFRPRSDILPYTNTDVRRRMGF